MTFGKYEIEKALIEKIKEVSTITTGFYAKAEPYGDTSYLHGRLFDKKGFLINDVVQTNDIRLNPKIEKHLLQDKDVLFVAKGENNRACLYHKIFGQAIASSLFFVIRVDPTILLPEYLHWYLNTPATKIKLDRISKGSGIPSISKKLLQEIEVYLPPIDVQKSILEMENLLRKEQEISKQILKEKENLYQQLLINLAKDESK